jgi:hypothetical protein
MERVNGGYKIKGNCSIMHSRKHTASKLGFETSKPTARLRCLKGARHSQCHLWTSVLMPPMRRKKHPYYQSKTVNEGNPKCLGEAPHCTKGLREPTCKGPAHAIANSIAMRLAYMNEADHRDQ